VEENEKLFEFEKIEYNFTNILILCVKYFTIVTDLKLLSGVKWRGIPQDLRTPTSSLRSATLFGRFYYIGRYSWCFVVS